ncbi:MAG: hypothetical protein JO033_11505 [Acidobacteriaceae bacterium]|nr:hypothetical protein [Acidobacteriaceae bacterium]MBV9500116.1 hypothetical protein [Acidobacteriaceae bacterium]
MTARYSAEAGSRVRYGWLILARKTYETNNAQVGKELLDEYWTMLKPFMNKVPKRTSDVLEGEISVIDSCDPPNARGSRASSSPVSDSAQQVLCGDTHD